MKILHIINSLATGGAEKLIAETLPLYAECGVEVDLLLLNGIEHPFFKDLASKKCCRIFSLGTGSIYNPLHIFRIIPFLKKYDLVHVHLFPAQYFVVLAKIISGANTKLIFTEHSTSNRRIRGNFLVRYLDVYIYKKYDKIIAISEKVRSVLQNYTKIEIDKFCVIENGVNIDKISRAIPANRNILLKKSTLKDCLIIQVSSFQEPKDQKTLIRAMALLPDFFKLILVGVGALQKESEVLVAELGLQKNVFFLGVRMDVPQLLKTADIVVLSSKYEGLSLSSIEGMASGKPFIASDVPGLKEIVAGAGILFPLGDVQKLAEEILQLATDENYYNRIAKQCMHRSQDFDIIKMVDSHLALYHQLINS